MPPITAQADSRLPCSWLDAFYGTSLGDSHGAHKLPHEADIAAFLFADCTPAPPCSCQGMRFDGNDDGERLGGTRNAGGTVQGGACMTAGAGCCRGVCCAWACLSAWHKVIAQSPANERRQQPST